MPFRKEFHDIISLLEEPLTLIELAKAGCLPPTLHINQIAQLLYPEEAKLQQATKTLLKAAIRDNELKVLTVEEFSKINMEHEQSRNAQKNSEPRPPGPILTLSCTMIAHQDTDLLPEDKEQETKKRRMFVVHRDEFQKWLQAENKWPLDKDILLANWWNPLSSEEVVVESGQSSSDRRVSLKDLIYALDTDPIYSDNKKSFLYLRDIIPEKEMPPFNPLGQKANSLLFVLAWVSLSKPPLNIYLPGKKTSQRLDWDVAKTLTDYRSSHGYQAEGSNLVL